MKIGSSVTTRYFGGYECVEIASVEDGFFVVSRFGGQGFDTMPKDQIEKVLRDGPPITIPIEPGQKPGAPIGEDADVDT